MKPSSKTLTIFSDNRGKVKFANDFNLSEFVRFYIVENADSNIIRAWQAHKVEKKAFLPISGKTKLVIVPILDFEKSIGGNALEVILDAEIPEIFIVPSGYANGIQSLNDDASVMVFSNLHLDKAKLDDFRFDKKLWYNWNEDPG